MAKILILEDDVEFASWMKLSLERNGHSVTLCDLASSALEILKSGKHDLLIADIIIRRDGKMTTEGGIKLIFQVKMELQRGKKSFPVIGISGVPNVDVRGRALDSAKSVGADRVLEKPFRPSELIDVVESLLAEHDENKSSGARIH